ncbi:DUF1206 domain-containing protein [Halalkalibacillus halophilus]|uniref:DUF1206 domain-containing protein n=1 Tax=Halalkalibacillus halophilus TaxID=392827 RepID=UPI0004174BF5|nr:DUF1206 domain-containing protein [Halalkalibacillus halophilus]
MTTKKETTSVPSKEQAKEEIKPWIRRFGRIGFMAKGIVFVLVGILTLLAAIGVQGNESGPSGMFQSLATMPFGEILLWLIGVGLLLYVGWLFVDIIKDPENNGLAVRATSFVTALIYSGLAYQAFLFTVQARSSGGGSDAEESFSAVLLDQPFGRWLIVIVALAIGAHAINEFYRGAFAKFLEDFDRKNMNKKEIKFTKYSGRLGLIARSVILLMVTFFLLQTAWENDPDESEGLDGALSQLSNEPYGQVLLGLTAVGLSLYGSYQIAKGRYQRLGLGK